MTDTHTHLYMDAYTGEESETVRRAIEAGVDRLVFPNVDMGSVEPMLRLHREFPENTLVAMGLHPTEVGEDWSEVLDAMEGMLDAEGADYAAIGEVGIDLYWDKSRVEEQKAAFARQIEWASERDLPLLIHCRDGLDECLEVISNHPGKLPRMVFHSFTGTIEDVRKVREVCDPWFGINGVVTFKNAPALREALSEIGLERMVLETDAPYLAPVPHRGTRNESAYVPLICAKIAETLGVSAEEVEAATDRNANQLLSPS